MSLLDRAKSMERGVEVILDWLGDGAEIVDRSVAQSRANTCLECPLNRPGSIAVKSVAAAIRKHVEVKNKLGIRVEGEKSLHECGICLCSLRLKVHVPAVLIKRHMIPGERDQFPDYCWQKTETE